MLDRVQLTLAAAALLLSVQGVARAESLVLWDQHIASAMRDSLVSDSICRGGPHSAFPNGCVGGDQVAFGSYDRLTALDQLALFVHRNQKLKFKHSLSSRTQVKFDAKMDNVLDPEATFRVQLKIRF